MINVKFDSKKNPLDEPQIVNAIKETERALEGRGRVLLRASGTESSVVRVMVEGEDAVHVNTLAQALAELVKQVR